MDKLFAIFGKLVLVLALLGLLIGVGFYASHRITGSVSINAPTATQTPSLETVSPAVTVIEVTQAPPATGAITGTLSYPSSGIPPLTVYAFDSTDRSKYFSVKTGENQSTFTITGVKPGSYVVVAYPDQYQVSGGWTKSVPCGLTVNCTDHTLIPVVVQSGQTASGVEVKDWYAPDGIFPTKP